MPNTLVARDLLKTERIIKANPQETLSQALAKIQSSHDAVFVTDANDKLLGVVSPYYVLFHANFPPTTKVENCLYSPPKLKEDSPLWEIARNMLESKVYYLPVFSGEGEWIGIVSIKTLIRAVAKDKNFSRDLVIPRKTQVITIDQNANLGEARALLMQKGVSKLPVINVSGSLVGILTRFDLRTALSEPRTSPSFKSRKGEKRKFIDKPIRNYFKKMVVTVRQDTSIAEIIKIMLDKEIGSVIVVNFKWQPIDIISYRDLLKAITERGRQKETSISTNIPEDFSDKAQFLLLLNQLIKKLEKRQQMDRVEAIIEVVRNAAQQIKLFSVTLRVSYLKKILIGTASDYKWEQALKKAYERVITQLARNFAE